jgi:hypothetical protein
MIYSLLPGDNRGPGYFYDYYEGKNHKIAIYSEII